MNTVPFPFIKLANPHLCYSDKKYNPITIIQSITANNLNNYITEYEEHKLISLLRKERAIILLRQRYIKSLNKKLVTKYVEDFPEEFI